MAYLGRGLDKISNIEVLDNITFDGSSSYSITKGSVAFTPNSAQSCLISIDGVVQATNFSVNSSTIDFGVAIPSTSTCNFFLHYGTGVMTVPSDGSVTESKIGSNAVSSAKMFSGFKNGITMADQWRITANTSVRSTEFLTANWERVDTTSAGFIGTGVTESSGVFTFPSTGIYLILATIQNETNGSRTFSGGEIHVTTNNSTYNIASQAIQSTDIGRFVTANPSFILDVTDTSNVKIKLKFISSGLDKTIGNTSEFKTGVSFIRLGDT